MDYKDYYAVLGVPRTATTAEVKKAYRTLARQHHPDRNPGDSAAERRFKEANEAHAVLSDPAKRKQYDELGAHWQEYARMGGRPGSESDPFGPGGPFTGFRPAGQGGAAGGAGGIRFEFAGDPGDFSEFFRTFFAGGMPGAAAGGHAAGRTRGRRARGGDGGANLDEMIGGIDFGAGARGAGGGTAGRAGTRRHPGHAARPAHVEATIEVSLEEALGGVTRLVEIDGRRLEVTIPAGVESGSRIRLRGQGGSVGETARDLVLVVRVRPHPVFTRDGANLVRELPVTLREALLGAEVPLTTPGGKRLLLTIPPATQPGRVIRLAGHGMPRLKGGDRGDLLVRVKVVLPALDERGREAAGELLATIHQPDPRERG